MYDSYRKKATRTRLHEKLILDDESYSSNYTLRIFIKNYLFKKVEKSLTEKQAQVFYMRIVYQQSFVEIAKELNCHVSTVKSHYQLALKKMKSTV